MNESTAVVEQSPILPESQDNQVMPSFPTKTQIDEYRQFLQNYDDFIASVLIDKVDFGLIPGVPKPSLFKPGAEKLEKLMFLSHEKICVEKIVESDYIKYTYRTVVYDKSGRVKSTCEGTANSKEKKNAYAKSVYDIENTIMKMAQKRSYVGAILEATNSSGRFTQDVEDMDLPQQPVQKKTEVNLEPLRIMVKGNLERLGKSELWLMEKIGKNLESLGEDGLKKVLKQLERLK